MTRRRDPPRDRWTSEGRECRPRPWPRALAGVAAALLLAGLLSACRSGGPQPVAQSPSWPYGPGERPRFYIVYLPYAQNGAPLAMPSPSAYGWTDERMERDVLRLKAAGLDGLVLALQPATVSDPLQTERVSRFLDLVESKGGAEFSVVIMLVAPGPAATSADAELIGRWLAAHDLQRHGSLCRRDGRVVLVCPPEVTLSGAPHPALYIVRTGSPGAMWTWGDPADAARSRPAGPEGQVLVYAGWRGRTAPVDGKGRPLWEMPRHGGRALETEISNAWNAKAGLICISSWNNYVAGDFVEPNSLDGDAVLKKLTAIVRQAREKGQAGTPRPAAGTAVPRPAAPPS